MTTLTYRRTVSGPPEVVWDVLTDHALYAEAAPNLATVEVVEGEGQGMVRRCIDTRGNEWLETCTDWREGEAFSVAVDVEGSDFHRRLFHRFEGRWGLEEDAEGVTMVMTFEFDPRFGPLGILISRYFAYRAPGIVETIFDRWEAAVEARLSKKSQQRNAEPAESGEAGENALYR